MQGSGVKTLQPERTPSVSYRRLYEEALEKIVVLESMIVSLRKLNQELSTDNHKLRRKDAPVSNSAFDWLSNLQYKVKSLGSRVAAFESGDKYTEMKATFKVQLAEKDREIQKLKSELADANALNASMYMKWSEVYEDLKKENTKELERKDRELKEMEKRALNAERQRDESKDKLLEKTRELYQVLTELEDEKGKNLKLTARLSQTHENSSKSSSLNPNHKKITNTREKSGKSPGGQVGHEWHPRKWHTPTNKIEIPAPKEYEDSANYVPTGKTVRKQLVDIRLEVIVNEYSTLEYRNIRTGERVHADFPGDLVLDVTYSGNVKAFALLLNSYCNVSIAKVSELISELTGGKLEISTGMINGLTNEFSRKTEEEQKKAFNEILLAPVMNTDFTTARVDGKNVNVAVCATPEKVLYFAKEHKGHKGIKGTPVEIYNNTLVHDHDTTYYKYGKYHQECLDHVLRDLADSMANEKKLKWSIQMRDLIREMIHFRKHLDPKDKRNPDEIDPGRVAGFEAKYDEIIKVAKEEYEYEPPSKYYKKGYNLYKRMEQNKVAHLLFLHDRNVPYSNSLSERLLRIFKRKQHQVMAFRSFGSLDKLCNALGTIATLREQGKSLFESVSAIFDMPVSEDVETVN
jgi:hypothetical protein